MKVSDSPDEFDKTSPQFSLFNGIVKLKISPVNSVRFSFINKKLTSSGVTYLVGFINKNDMIIETHKMVIILQSDKSWKLLSDTKIK